MKAPKGNLSSVTGDAAYDTLANYKQAASRGARVVVPPTRSASVSNKGTISAERDRTIRAVEKLGRREWKKEAGYHRQGPSRTPSSSTSRSSAASFMRDMFRHRN